MYTRRNIYDAAGRLITGTRYAGASTTGTAAFTERGISYDKAGGMLALQRYGQNASTAEDNISLTYNGMRLSSVTGTVGGQSINASFTYDDCGRTTYDGVSALNYAYDQIGALASVSDASTSVTLTTYRHLADGTKYATVSPSGGALIYRGPFTLKVADISASTPSVSFLRAETGSAGAAIIANASGTGAAPYYYVADHIGSIRAIVDAQGNIVERNDYYTYGKRHTTGRTYATLANSQLLFSGKEDLGQALDLASGATIGTSDLRILDFGARHYDPIVPRWTTQDPLAEKYFPINTYAYCAGDPVNLVDPEGMNWYSYVDSTGITRYKYVEGQLSKNEIKKGGYKDLGYTFRKGNKYYSLFGKIYERDCDSPIIELISSIDRFIINYVNSVTFISDSPYNQDIPSSVTDFSNVKTKFTIPFQYQGLTFSSIKPGTFFFPIGKTSFRGQIIEGDSKLIMLHFVTGGNMPYGGLNQNATDPMIRDSYWIVGSSQNTDKKSNPLQIRFDKAGAEAFLKSLNNIFGTSFGLSTKDWNKGYKPFISFRNL